jgi:hypothetical protein
MPQGFSPIGIFTEPRVAGTEQETRSRCSNGHLLLVSSNYKKHLNGIQEVRSSILLVSTIKALETLRFQGFFLAQKLKLKRPFACFQSLKPGHFPV